MAGSVKISQLPDGTLNLSELDLIPFVDHETMKTKSATLAALGQYIQDQQAAITSTDQLPEGFFNLYYTDDRVGELVDSAYIQARITFPESTDSSSVISTIDSDYINARVDHPEGLITDSSDITSIIDSDYINARVDAQLLESTDSLSEGSINFYYTKSRFDSDLSLATTTDLAEGTNLYYTDARVENFVDSAYVQARQIVDSADNGVYINVNPPAEPIMGQQWLEIPDSGDAVLWIYDGSGWLESPSKVGPAGQDGSDGTSIDSDNLIFLTIETVDSDYIQSRQIVGIDSATSIALTVETVDSAFLSNKISLDGLTDVTSTNPSSGEFLKYNGAQWVPATFDVDAGIVFKGTVNAVDSVAPSTPKNGDMYINTESGIADASWAGLGNVDSDMQLLWESDEQSWVSIGGAGAPSGVQTIEEGVGITVDDTLAESPSVSVNKTVTDSWYYTQSIVDSMFASVDDIVINIVDSAYVNSLVDQVPSIDSEATISLIQNTVDSDYIKLIVETTPIILDADGPSIGGDSSGPEYGQVFGIDSATSIALTIQTVDSAYVNARSGNPGADTALGERIDSDYAWNVSEHNTLQSNIDAEVTARSNADSDLNARLDSETAARIAADSDLMNMTDPIADASSDGVIATWNDSVSQWQPNTGVVVNSSGNVGIGTTGPNEDLEIRKDNASGLGAVLSLTNNNSSGQTGNSVAIGFSAFTPRAIDTTEYRGAIIRGETTATGNGHSLLFETSDTSQVPVERMRIDASGHTFIKDDTNGDLRLGEVNNIPGLYSGDGKGMVFRSDVSADVDLFTWKSSSTSKMVMDGSGNLGIDMDPDAAGAKLQVAGSGSFSGNLSVETGRILRPSNSSGLVFSSTGLFPDDGTGNLGGADGTMDLGGVNDQWKDGFFSETVTATAFINSSGGGIMPGGNPTQPALLPTDNTGAVGTTAANNMNLGNNTYEWRNGYFSGTVNSASTRSNLIIQDGSPVRDARHLYQTLKTLRTAVDGQTTFEGLRDALKDALTDMMADNLTPDIQIQSSPSTVSGVATHGAG